MRVLLVSPATPDTFWSFKHALPFIAKRASFPPLGLLTVAAMLPRDWELKLVDLNARRLHDKDIAWADYVMISAMLVQEASAREVVARCRTLGKPVIAGGPLFTTGYERFPEVQHFVLGEAESLMPELVADMLAGRVQRLYRSPQRPDITCTPIPRWDLIRMQDYALMPIQFSRGCPFNCEFCDIIVMNGRVPRVKTTEQMIRELDSLVAAGWRGSIFIVDDNFIGNRVKARQLLEAIIQYREKKNVPLVFTTEASLNIVDHPELLELMARAGFRKIFVGIETPAEESLLECAKVQNTRRDLVAAVRTIQKAGIEVMGGFIVGFDSDTPSIFERQKEFIQQSGIVTAMVGLLTALPDTRLWQRLQAEGRILRESTGNNLECVLNFVPRLDRDVLVQGYRTLVKHLYQPRVYYDRALCFLREYKPRNATFWTWREVMAVIKAMWVMGLWSRGRRAYWAFLGRVLIRHPRAFADAMTLAIVGYHFRRVAATI
ncbi:MAG TPA: B12-binding domain-containing radical SAM protein [Phycisphaerae bacterium]|nr:B12-binding domain-containing radical SAM protein [Phycisphaerae bacterium]